MADATAMTPVSFTTIASSGHVFLQWFYDTFGSGDPVVVKNSVGVYDTA